MLKTVNEQFQQEISERKKDEVKIHLQNDALEATAHSVMITDPEGIIEWCNQAFTMMTGYSKEEVIGKNPRILRSGKHNLEFYKDLWQTIKSGQVWRGEMINRRKDGTLYPEDQTITPVKDQNGNITHFVAVKQDVTERKQAQEKLQAVNEQLDAVIFNMPVGVAILEGPEFKYSKINRTLAEINGLSVEDHIGRPLAEVIPQAAKDIIPRLRKVWRSNKTSPQHEFSTRLPKDPDHGKYFIDCFFPIEGKNGKVEAVGTVVLDITNRKESELVLKESHDLLECRVRERTKELRRSEKDLIRQKQILEEKNIALNEIIAQIEIEKNKIKENIMSNVDQVLMPSLKSLKRKGTRLDKTYIDLLEKNLRELSSTFGKKISEKEWNLTPKEIKICDLIRNGLGNKEIASLLNTSLRTIESHRNNIRKKLGISGKAVNLTTCLQFF